jgi:hypothetical protein
MTDKVFRIDVTEDELKLVVMALSLVGNLASTITEAGAVVHDPAAAVQSLVRKLNVLTERDAPPGDA